MKRRAFLIPLLVVAALLVMLPAASTALAFGWTSAPTQIAAAGIGHDPGSWQNSYPWSMSMFNGDLYVGTGRVGCTSAVMSLMAGPMGGGAGIPLPGGMIPGNDPQPPQIKDFLSADGTSVTDNAKFDAFNAVSRAEIWRYHCGTWERVFQAPMIPSYLKGSAAPYSAAAITGFRGMKVFTDAHGVRALYAAAGGFTFAAQQPLMMRSTDGVTWTPVYAPPVMGRESRALWVHHGRLYVGVGYSGLGGKVAAGAWASADPADPTSWTKVIDFPTLDPTNTNVVSFASYFGRLYLGTENSTGFQVWRSKVADPMGNGDWKKVVTGGAGMAINEWAGTMKVFDGWLYVGSMHVPGISGSTQVKGFDLIRISPWDTWQLVIGDPRTAVTPWGTRMMTPISGKPSGMGNPTQPLLLEPRGQGRAALPGHLRPDHDAQGLRPDRRDHRRDARAVRSPGAAALRRRRRRPLLDVERLLLEDAHADGLRQPVRLRLPQHRRGPLRALLRPVRPLLWLRGLADEDALVER